MNIIYDASAEEELLDVTNVKKLHDCRDLWAPSGGVLPRTVEWDFPFDKVANGEDVKLTLESEDHPTDPSGTDPSLVSISEIRNTHRLLAQQLEDLCDLAVRTGSKVWTTRLLAPGRTRVDEIVGDPEDWQNNVHTLTHLQYAHGKTIAKLLKRTLGGEMCECIVPDAMNVNTPIALAQSIRLVERQQSFLDFMDVPNVAMLHPLTPTRAVVEVRQWEAMLFTALHRGRVASWNGPTSGTTNPYTAIDAGLKAWITSYASF